MTYLIFAACLLSAPEHCNERRIPSPTESASPFCVLTAQATLSQWARDHPGWQIKTWRCETHN